MKKKIMGWLLILALFVGSLASVPMETLAKNQTGDWNIMLVIDGSGSLSTNGGTDVNGLRFEAIDLLFSLLPESDIRVGAIVFDDSQPMPLDSGLISIQSKADKEHLSDRIRSAQAGGDTDIGGALQTGLDELTKDGNYSKDNTFILLFSDGETDLSSEEAMQTSLEQKENAMEQAKELGIPIHSICLNSNDSANTSEVEKLAEGTDGIYLEIRDANDLENVFTEFYRLLNGDSEPIPVPGNFEQSIRIPSCGVKEAAAVIRTDGETIPLSMLRPDGTFMTDSELNDVLTYGNTYEILKLVDPDPGVWTLRGEGDPNTKVYLNLIFNTNLGAEIVCDADTAHIPVNSAVDFSGYLLIDSERVSEEAPYEEYGAQLIIQNEETGEEQQITMESNGASFAGSAELSETGTYLASIKLVCDDLERSSETITLTVEESGVVSNAADTSDSETPAKKSSPVLFLIPLLLVLIAAIVVFLRKKAALNNAVCNYTIMVESFDNEIGMYSQPYSQSGFKGRLPLTHFQINECGVHGEFQVVPVKGKRYGKCEFVSKEKFETEAGMLVNKVAINQGDDLRLYAPSQTEEGRQQKGVHIIIEMSYEL
jgi:Mg-chelatase subunit ChlD